MAPIKNINLKRIFAWSIVGMVAIDAAFDTGPMVCAVDPTCRKMTKDEIAMARPIFGSSIAYEKVCIFKRPSIYKIFNEDSIAATILSNIYLSPQMGANKDNYGQTSRQEDAAGIFMHELTHVWQNQNLKKQQNEQDPDYSYTLSPHLKFTDYNREQQAEIVHGYFEMRRTIIHPPSREFCAKLVPYETMLKSAPLPVQPLTACLAPKS
jgi:hypothetical protein